MSIEDIFALEERAEEMEERLYQRDRGDNGDSPWQCWAYADDSICGKPAMVAPDGAI